MTKTLGRKLLLTATGAGVLFLSTQGTAEAFGLGIPALDALLTTIEQGIPRCGLIFGFIGGAGLTLAKFENQYSTFLSGYVNFFTIAGVFGALGTLLGALGIVG